MIKRSAALACCAALLFSGAAFASRRRAPRAGAWARVPGLYAKFETSRGAFVCVLWPKKAPVTVGNFVGLAAGVKAYDDARSGDLVKTPFYDGLIFTRVVPAYLIQSGDLKGDGTGGPGYLFDDEVNGLQFDAPGMLAMANYGPDTNGSQFFVTDAAAPALDDVKDSSGVLTTHFTIFGKVVDGLSVVDAISKAPTTPGTDRPAEPVTLEKVTLIQVNARRRAKPLTQAEAEKLAAASEKENDNE